VVAVVGVFRRCADIADCKRPIGWAHKAGNTVFRAWNGLCPAVGRIAEEGAMFVSGITERGAMPALVQMWSFTQQRHKVIAENVANWGNPGYRTRHVDARAFQTALGEALRERGGDPRKPLVVESTGQFHNDERGRLVVTPTEQPVENILFHDGTNESIERQMSDLAENAMAHEAVTTLLRGGYQTLRKAISGRV